MAKVLVESKKFRFEAEFAPELEEPFWVLSQAYAVLGREAQKYQPQPPKDEDKGVREQPSE